MDLGDGAGDRLDGFGKSGGETAALIRAFDWGATPLGPMADWPQSLKTTTQIMLGSPVAMVLLWGPQGVLIYNDAYARFADRRHPEILGRPAAEAWPEIADFNRDIYQRVLGGETLSLRDQMLVLSRSGEPEAVYLDLDYSPVPDESGRPAGELVVVVETTQRRADRLKLADERQRLEAMFEAAPSFMGLLEGPEHRFVLANAAYRRLVGGRDLVGLTVAEALPEVVEQGFVGLLDQVLTTGQAVIMAAAPVELNTGPGGMAETHWLDFVYQPLRGPDGTITGVFVEGYDVTGLYAAGEALKASEARYRALFESMDEAFCVIELIDGPGGALDDYVHVEANAALADHTGIPDVVGRKARELMGAEAEDWIARYREVLESGQPIRFEKELAATGRWLELAAFRIEPRERNQVAVLFKDLTERRRANEALKASEARKSALLELSVRIAELTDPDDISFTGAEVLAKALKVDRAGYGLIDRERETISIARDWNAPGVTSLAGVLQFRDYGSYIEQLKRGQTVVIADAREDDRTRDTAGALEAINARSFVNMPVTEEGRFVALLYLNHGERRDWGEEELTLIREAASTIRTAVERRRAETALRALNTNLEARVAEALAEKRLLADLVDGADAFVQVADPDYRFIAINKASADEFERIYGVRPQVGDSMLDLLADRPDHRDAVQAVWARALSGESFVETGSFGDPSRERRSYEMRFSPLEDSEGRQVGAYQFVYDVTERLRDQGRLREAEQALHQSQKMETVGQLTGGVAHDFNNLLTPIVGALDMLQRRPDNDARASRLIEGALTAADRAKTLVHRLLAFSRRQHLEPRAVDVGAVLETLRDLIARSLGPGIALMITVEPDLPPAHVDPNQLELALLNLAVNARDAMGEDGTLSITAEEADCPTGRCVRIAVADTGAGMDAETLARAVEPFFTTKEVGRGTGLGLSSVKGLAEQSGGEFSLESEVGRGTTAILTLPAASGPAEAEGVEPEMGAVAGGRAVILLVDDEPGVRMGAADMLAEAGYTVVEASGPTEALREVEGGLAFDLLITDYAMPGMSGARLAAALKDRRPDLPVLLTTGYASMREGDVEGLPRLAKPFRQTELISAVRAVLRR